MSIAAAANPAGIREREEAIGAAAIVGAIAAVKFALHMATAKTYGFFIDEIYFLACGEHLAWGYVDMPPLTAFQAWLTRRLFGDSPFSIRLFPSLAGAGLVVLAAALARALGGRRLAQGLAALSILTAIVYLAFDSYLSMNSIEPLIWTGCALLVVRMIQTRNTRLWVPFGLLAGIGLENKHTMLLFGFALVAGLLATRDRVLMRSRWFVVGGAVAFAISLPNLVWNVRHHFPMLELLANIRKDGRDVVMSPARFFATQVLFVNPVAAPLWIAGLASLLAGRLARFRALGWAFLATAAVLLATRGKFYYLGPAFATLLAAGAVAFENTLARPSMRRLRIAYPALLLAAGAAIAPTWIPLLSPEDYLRYARATGIAQPKFEHRATTTMPQFFADRFGWPEMAQTVAKAWHALPEDERAKTGIFANDYGQGGAIDFYGPKLGLPKAIGGHLSYWLWGPRGYTGESLLVLGDDRETLETEFESVEAVGEIGHPRAMRQEHFTLFHVRHPRGGMTLARWWPELKHFH